MLAIGHEDLKRMRTNALQMETAVVLRALDEAEYL